MSVISQVVVPLFLGYVFISSGLIVNLIQLCMTFLIWPFNRSLYRKASCGLAYMFWSQFTFMAEYWSRSKIKMYMKKEDFKYIGKEHAIVIMNHTFDIEWLAGYMICERAGMLGGSKVYGKKILRYMPLIGWTWYFTESLFLDRNWDSDQKVIVHDIQRLVDYPLNYWVNILCYCEGTRFTESKHKASMEFAKKNGYPPLKHHLLPRTKGFVLSLKAFNGKLPAVYDCTVLFRSDGCEPTLKNVVQGKAFKAEVLVRRFPVSEIPMETDEACSEWVHQLYREKDEIFEKFLQCGHLEGDVCDLPMRYHNLIAWLFWAIILYVPLFMYVGSIVIYGSLLQNAILVGAVIAAALGCRAMISVSEIKKGSGYGGNDKKRS